MKLVTQIYQFHLSPNLQAFPIYINSSLFPVPHPTKLTQQVYSPEVRIQRSSNTSPDLVLSHTQFTLTKRMGIKGIELLGVLGLGLVVVALVGEAEAQSISCTTAVTNLAPCLNYITGNSSTPSSSCCSKLSDVVQSSPQCLCSVVNGGAIGSLGITINKTRALSLPGACNVRTPPISQCQGTYTNL